MTATHEIPGPNALSLFILHPIDHPELETVCLSSPPSIPPGQAMIEIRPDNPRYASLTRQFNGLPEPKGLENI